jgi:CHAT domain-containing protein/Tfp pilus assembly protein PilF
MAPKTLRTAISETRVCRGKRRPHLRRIRRTATFFAAPSAWLLVAWLLILTPIASGRVGTELEIGEQQTAAAQDKTSNALERAFQEAEQLRARGDAESLRKAIEKYQEAISAYRAAGDRKGEAQTLTVTALVYQVLGEKEKALDCYSRALALHEQLGDRDYQIQTLNGIALVYKDLGNPRKALEYLEQALPIAQGSKERQGEATTLHNMGLVYYTLGEKLKSIDYCNKALVLQRALGNKRGEANLLGAIGVTYASMGESRTALEYYNQALSIFRSIEDRRDETMCLLAIGRLNQSMDDYGKALDYYNEAAGLARTLKDRAAEAATLLNIASIFEATGEFQKAIESYNNALRLHRDVGYRPGEAADLGNLGGVYRSLGDYEKALDLYTQALSLQRAVQSRTGEATALENLGSIQLRLGDSQSALDSLTQSVSLRRALGERRGEAAALNGLGQVYLSTSNYEKATELFNQALTLNREVGSRRGEALSLTGLGQVYARLGDHEKAINTCDQGLSIFKAIGDRGGEASTLHTIARIERSRGNIAAARSRVEYALQIIESLRSTLFDQTLRASYLASAQEAYETYIDVLMRLHKEDPSAGYDAAALQASERARARGLLELLTESAADIRQGVDPALLERERSLQHALNIKANRQRQLLAAKHTPEQAAAALKELDSAAAEYQNVEAQIRSSSPRYAALTQPAPLSIAEIRQQVLDPTTLLLEYSLGDERSYLWVVSSTSITSHELPGREAVESAARRFYELSKSNGDMDQIAEAASGLSQMLLAPAAAQLGTTRLLIVANGALQYVPFAALPVPGLQASPNGRLPSSASLSLIAEHEIITLPSASTLAVLRRETAGRVPVEKAVAAIADPVFGTLDPRVDSTLPPPARKRPDTFQDFERAGRELGVTGADAQFPRLLGTRREAEAVLALAAEGDSKRALDFAASRATATSPELSRYRVVLFATHALLNNSHPELSGIVLSLVDEQGKPQDGFLRLHDIYNLKLPAEVIVLSACQTGLGKDVKGEGLVGLTRGFMYAGARRVVATLWKVDDKATAELMKLFFEGLLKAKLRPAEALRTAQINLAKQRPWQSPYYWAAFVLQGEWK